MLQSGQQPIILTSPTIRMYLRQIVARTMETYRRAARGLVALRRVDAGEHHPARRAGPQRPLVADSRRVRRRRDRWPVRRWERAGGARSADRARQRRCPLAPDRARGGACWRRSRSTSSRRTVPGPHRQVNERWMDEYRGWVYGLGFGIQLGLGVTTVVTSAATYVALLAAFLAPSVAGGALIMGCFGAARGLTLLAGAGIRTPPQLVALHGRLAGGGERAVWTGAGVLVAVLVVALVAGAT